MTMSCQVGEASAPPRTGSLNGHTDLLGAGQAGHYVPGRPKLRPSGRQRVAAMSSWLAPDGPGPGDTVLASVVQMLRRALVLGGGGVTGVAWEVGLLLGLAEAGVDLGAADLLVGTSAGSVVAAQVACGVPLEEMFARQVESASGEIAASIG